MNFISQPNLPEREVELVIIDAKAHEYFAALEKLGISLIETKPRNDIDSRISTHPDMQICHLGQNRFLSEEGLSGYYIQEIEKYISSKHCEKINKRVDVKELSTRKGIYKSYPEECILNTVVENDWIIAHYKNELFQNEEKNIIRVRQGYVKCSVCIVSDNAIITSDKSIEKSALLNGIDVCYVTNDSIQLKGYNYGFIGGTCGKISKSKIVFFGDVDTHPDANKIISFCEKYNVECISLSNGPLQDFGSLIPIIEI